jgi:hypothetical protein
MRCPECDSISVQSFGKRNFPYPFVLLVIFRVLIALLHQTSSPIDYRCQNCGLHFARRSGIARAALTVLIVLVVLIALAFMSLFLQTLV